MSYLNKFITTLRLNAGTTTVAPAVLASGPLLTTPVAGAAEFLTDKLYVTITTGVARKELTLNDIVLTSGRIPFTTTEGRLTDSSALTFSAGTLTSTNVVVTDEAYGVLWNGSLQVPTKNAVYDKVETIVAGQSDIFADHFTDAGNSGTSETDLYTDGLTAGLLAINGQKVEAVYGGSFVSSATATRQIKVKFGPSGGETTILDTGALSISGSSSWQIYCLVQRVNATTVRYVVGLQTSGASLAVYNSTGEITGLTLANAQVLKITGQAAGVGAATNDIVASLGYAEFKPNA